ncbi:hypothetical protein GCM10020219_104990 [Nonomuraea dietziae]
MAAMGGVVLHAPAAHATPIEASAAKTAAVKIDVARTSAAKASAGKARVVSKSQAKAARQKLRAAKAVGVAKKQLGDPYRYGGTGPGSFDCSGLVQYAWSKAGIRIPRVTHSQYARIKKKVSWRSLKPGDLMFFRGKGHVGMYVGKGRMIHSPSSGKTVRIEKISGWRKSSFAGAVRPGA